MRKAKRRSPSPAWRRHLAARVRLGRRAWAGLAALAILVTGLALVLLWPRDNTLQQIQSRGAWRVGLDPSFPPFETFDPASGLPVGYDVDLANAIAGRLGVQVHIVTAGFDELIDAVAARRFDSAVSAMPAVPARSREVSFSVPYLEAGLVLAAPGGSAITGTASLSGRRVAVEWGSEGDALARDLRRQLGGRLEIEAHESPQQALEAAASHTELASAAPGGAAAAALVDAVSLALYNRDAGSDRRLRAVGPPLRSDPYVVVVPKDAPGLLAAINDAIVALRADGTLAELQRKWLAEYE